MAMLKAPPIQPKNTTVQIRVEGEVKVKLQRYADFIGASSSYVVSEALKFLFRKDEEFKRWTDHHTDSHNQQFTEGDPLTKTV